MRKAILIKKGINPSLYNAWVDLKRRCDNPNYAKYHRYGGRGITYEERWNSYPEFLEDMECTWFEGAVLDRENNDGDYCSENCRWITNERSLRNTSRIKLSLSMAEDIRKLYKTGSYTQRQLATQFKTDRGTINAIIQGQLWV